MGRPTELLAARFGGVPVWSSDREPIPARRDVEILLDGEQRVVTATSTGIIDRRGRHVVKYRDRRGTLRVIRLEPDRVIVGRKEVSRG